MKQQLSAQVLDQDTAVEAALRWRDDCTRIAVERAALWMPEPPHFGSKRRRLLASDMDEDTAPAPSAGEICPSTATIQATRVLSSIRLPGTHRQH